MVAALEQPTLGVGDRVSIDGRLPAVLGAGLTGVAVSRALSVAGVPHLLVGAPPGDEPRLGESINAEGSIELLERFPDQRSFFFPKDQMALFFGPNALSFDFVADGGERSFGDAFGFPTAVPLLHVDRIGLDAALFEVAVRDPCCRFVEGRAVDLDVHRGSDRITAVALSSGDVLRPEYVFDCSNRARFVGEGLDLRRDVLGAAQRVVFAHCHRSFGDKAPWVDPPFSAATSLLRLARPDADFDALGWAIPLGDYVSVGVNVESDATAASGATLLRLVLAGFAARGLDVIRYFPDIGAPVEVGYEHFAYERACGKNWMLAGPAFCQTWFPSGAGVGTSLAAARFAPDVLVDPRRVGAVYEAYMRRIVAMHGTLEWLSVEDPGAVSAAELGRRAAAMVRSNAKRLSLYLASRGARGTRAMRSAFAQVYESDRVWATGCRVVSAAAGEQARRVIRRRSALAPGLAGG